MPPRGRPVGITFAPSAAPVAGTRCVLACPRSIGAGEEIGHFLVAGLAKVDVVNANGVEGVGRSEADDLIGVLGDRFQRLTRRDRNGENKPRGSLAAESL